MRKILIGVFLLLSALGMEAQSLPPQWNDICTDSIQNSALVRKYVSPQRVLWMNGNVSNPDRLLRKGIGQTELSGRGLVKMKNEAGTEPASVLLDFGKELQGGIQINVNSYSGGKEAKVRVRFGESVSEAMSDVIGGTTGATNDHAMRDFVMNVPNMGIAEAGNSGFRFVRIDLLGEGMELNVKEIRAIFSYRDIPYVGSFECNDQRLNKIWMTGAYTVHLNMQEYVWDGIKRDRLVWIGDLHPEVMTINTVFGYNEVVPKSLDHVRDITPPTEWMNTISSYSLWWILIHRDWYFNHGDKAYLEQQQDYLTKLVSNLLTKVEADGTENLGGWRFLDWPSSPNAQGVKAGLHALLAMTFDAAAELFVPLNDPFMAQQCREKAALLRTRKPDYNGSKQGAALLALSGIVDAKKINDESLAVGGAKGFSTFYGYYMLRAMAKAGNVEGALQIISDYWGGMLDLGATTFWEDFDMDWLNNAGRIDELPTVGKVDVHAAYGDYCYRGHRHSFCHGWASGPTAWLSEVVLGVTVLEPGCKTVRIRPDLGTLQWAKGTYPTPYGAILIHHVRQNDGTIKSTIRAPKGVKVVR